MKATSTVTRRLLTDKTQKTAGAYQPFYYFAKDKNGKWKVEFRIGVHATLAVLFFGDNK